MKNWALWSLFAVAVSVTVVLAVPNFRAYVAPSNAVALACAVAVGWMFVLTRAIKPMLNVVSRHTRYREQARRSCHSNKERAAPRQVTGQRRGPA
jgi:hypothetical protein